MPKMTHQQKPHPIILKSRKGIRLRGSVNCDECGEVKRGVYQFEKSNRFFKVNICRSCLPVVMGRSFPSSTSNRSWDDEYIWNENFNNDDLEISKNDAMNHARSGGAFESNPRRH